MCLQKTFVNVFVFVCVSIPSSFSSLFFLFFAGSKLFHVTLSFFSSQQTAKLVLDDAAKIEKIKKEGEMDDGEKAFYRLYINLFSRAAAPHSIFLCLFVCNRFERVFFSSSFRTQQRGSFVLSFKKKERMKVTF